MVAPRGDEDTQFAHVGTYMKIESIERDPTSPERFFVDAVGTGMQTWGWDPRKQYAVFKC